MDSTKKTCSAFIVVMGHIVCQTIGCEKNLQKSSIYYNNWENVKIMAGQRNLSWPLFSGRFLWGFPFLWQLRADGDRVELNLHSLWRYYYFLFSLQSK